MAYPINPPATFHFLRRNLHAIEYLGSGLWCDTQLEQRWFYWAPPWRQDQVVDTEMDWLVGPYMSLRSAGRALKRFVDNEGDGPELRTWEP